MSHHRQLPLRGLFVTGTGTEVGKTYVACLLARSLISQGVRVGVYKPAASGGRRIDGRCVCDDAIRLWQAAGCPATIDEVCPQMFLEATAPHVAARREGKQLDANRLIDGLTFWHDQCDFVIVEGAGGYLSPISDELLVADIAHEIGYPLMVVSANRLGTINDTLQTLLAIRRYRGGMPVAAAVLNDASSHDELVDASCGSNFAEIERRTEVRWLPPLRHGQTELPFDISEL